MRLALDHARQAPHPSLMAQMRGLVGLRHPDEDWSGRTRAAGTKRERAVAGVEFGRNSAMLAAQWVRIVVSAACV